MILVLFLLAIIIVFLLILLLLVCSYLKININKLEANNIESEKINYFYKANIGIYLFKKIKIFGFNINSEKFKHSKLSKKIHLDKSRLEKSIVKLIIKDIKKVDIKIEELNFDLTVGTEDVLLTLLAVFIISLAISLYLPHKVDKDIEKIKYCIKPHYNGKNLFSVELNCIINTKMVHIMNIVYTYFKKRREVDRDERASNRGFNDNCDEQYSGYGRCEYNYRRTN